MNFVEFIILIAFVGFTSGSLVVAVALGHCMLTEIFGGGRRRQQPVTPHDWQRLTTGSFPITSRVKAAAVKSKLSNSCEVHGKCVPRAGWYGLISHPLTMDE